MKTHTFQLEFKDKRKTITLAISVGTATLDGKEFNIAMSGTTLRVGDVSTDLQEIIGKMIEEQIQ